VAEAFFDILEEVKKEKTTVEDCWGSERDKNKETRIKIRLGS